MRDSRIRLTVLSMNGGYVRTANAHINTGSTAARAWAIHGVGTLSRLSGAAVSEFDCLRQ